MTIRPAELHDLTPEELKQVDVFEKQIDAKLHDMAGRQGFKSSYAYFPQVFPSYRVGEELVERYDAVGWDLEVNHEQKLLKFTCKPESLKKP